MIGKYLLPLLAIIGLALSISTVIQGNQTPSVVPPVAQPAKARRRPPGHALQVGLAPRSRHGPPVERTEARHRSFPARRLRSGGVGRGRQGKCHDQQADESNHGRQRGNHVGSVLAGKAPPRAYPD